MKNYLNKLMLHVLKCTQVLKSDLDTVWEFMRSPNNLAKITPEYLKFQILSDPDDLKDMYPGQLVEYYVSPVLGIRMHWVTEITHVQHKVFFVDEQRFGPYKFWHHKHFLKEVPEGVEMIDVVHYKIPYGFLGKIAHKLFIKKKVNEIFDQRFKRLEEMFNHGK
jgi:ligand-binding SRPBCC domain-containing protein